MTAVSRVFKNLYAYFREGFASMTVGKTLWIMVLIKLFIMFGILRVFFFPNFLKHNFDNETDRADHVRTELIDRALDTQ